MKASSARWLLRLYPRAWRERYGEELAALTGERVDWRTAVDLVKGAVRERARASVAIGRRELLWLAIGLTAGVSTLLLIAGLVETVVGVLAAGWPIGTAAAISLGEVGRAVPAVGSIVSVFAAFAVLLALIVNWIGWPRRRPRAAAFVVRFGVALVFLALEAAASPPFARISPLSAAQIVMAAFAAAFVGHVAYVALFAGKSSNRAA